MNLNEEVYTRAINSLKSYPLGSKFRAISGGYWERVINGFKWCTGDTFPNLGGDWDGTVSMTLNKLLEQYKNDNDIQLFNSKIKDLSENDNFKEDKEKMEKKRDEYINNVYRELKIRELI